MQDSLRTIREKGYTADKPVYERLKQSLQGMEEGNIDRFLEYLDKVMGATDFREGADGANAKKEITVDDINRV